MTSFIQARAPAKLNLALSVGRAITEQGPTCGMHPIASWMVTIDLFDELHLVRLPAGVLSRYAILWHPDAPRRSDINWSVSRDLAVRAHLELERHVGRPLPVQLKLEKRIPVGGGLGGGSSDAAAMLRATNDLHGLGLSLDELTMLGARLGSDVPYLVRGGAAVVEGLGDRVMPTPIVPTLHAVVAFPRQSCATSMVYKAFDERLAHDAELRADFVRELAASAAVGPETPFNDLTQAAFAVAPGLAEQAQSLADLAGRPAHVSGSGSSLFVICDDAMHALALADAASTRLQMPATPVRTIGDPSI